jgi:hypothetical protein
LYRPVVAAVLMMAVKPAETADRCAGSMRRRTRVLSPGHERAF